MLFALSLSLSLSLYAKKYHSTPYLYNSLIFYVKVTVFNRLHHKTAGSKLLVLANKNKYLVIQETLA